MELHYFSVSRTGSFLCMSQGLQGPVSDIFSLPLCYYLLCASPFTFPCLRLCCFGFSPSLPFVASLRSQLPGRLLSFFGLLDFPEVLLVRTLGRICPFVVRIVCLSFQFGIRFHIRCLDIDWLILGRLHAFVCSCVRNTLAAMAPASLGRPMLVHSGL